VSGYVRATKFESTFDGKVIKATLAPLSFPDYLKLQSVEVKDELDAARVTAEILPKYVKEWDGPVDSEGQPVPVEEVCSTAYFSKLILNVGAAMLSAAQIVDPGKPGEPSAS
jgi:hypothetical protein